MLDIRKSGARYMHFKYTIETRCNTQPTWEQQKIQISLNMYTKGRAHQRKWEPNYTVQEHLFKPIELEDIPEIFDAVHK